MDISQKSYQRSIYSGHKKLREVGERRLSLILSCYLRFEQLLIVVMDPLVLTLVVSLFWKGRNFKSCRSHFNSALRSPDGIQYFQELTLYLPQLQNLISSLVLHKQFHPVNYPYSEDIRAFLPSVLHLKREQVELEIEKLIRAYDPCFSCSTHFLEVKWK